MGSLFDWCGPILTRELLQVARRKRYYLLRIVVAAVLLCVMYACWKGAEAQFGIRVMSRLAEQVSYFILLTQLGVALILMPLLLCDSISSERRAANFEILFTTPLGAKEVIFGKLMSRLLLFMLLVAVCLPILSLMQLFGGISLVDVLTTTALAIAIALFEGSITLHFSSRTLSPVRAVLGTFARTLTITAALSILVSLLTSSLMMVGGWPPITASYIAAWLIATSLGIIAIFYYFDTRDKFAEYGREITKAKPANTRFEYMNEFQIERFFGKRSPLWKDRSLQLVHELPQKNGRILLLFGLAVVLSAIIARDRERAEGLAVLTALVQAAIWIVALLTCMGIACTNPVIDRQGGFFELLLISPLTNREILRGSFLCCWPRMKWFLFAAAICSCFIWNLNTIAAVAAFAVGTLLCGLVYITATVGKIVYDKSYATVFVVVACMILLIGNPFLLAAIQSLLSPVLAASFIAIASLSLSYCKPIRDLTSDFIVRFGILSLLLNLICMIIPDNLLGFNGSFPAHTSPYFWITSPFSAFHLRYWEPEKMGELAALLARYLLSLGSLTLWSILWTIRNFDKLADRMA